MLVQMYKIPHCYQYQKIDFSSGESMMQLEKQAYFYQKFNKDMSFEEQWNVIQGIYHMQNIFTPLSNWERFLSSFSERKIGVSSTL